jgi:hypothetical protein
MDLPFKSATLTVYKYTPSGPDPLGESFSQLNDTVSIGESDNNQLRVDTGDSVLNKSSKLGQILISHVPHDCFNFVLNCFKNKKTYFQNKLSSLGENAVCPINKSISYLAIPIVNETLKVRGVIYSQIEGCTDADATIDYISDNWPSLSGVSIRSFMNPARVSDLEQVTKPLDTPLEQPFVSVVNHVLQVSSFKQTIDRKSLIP